MSDETALACEDAANALVTDLEEVLGICIGDIDALTVEVLVEVLHLLVACKEHQTTGALRGGHHVVDVGLAELRHNVSRDANILTRDLGHFDSFRSVAKAISNVFNIVPQGTQSLRRFKLNGRRRRMAAD